MRVVVTGASGFIGRYVISELLKYPVEIIAIDKKKNIYSYNVSNINYVNIDITTSSIDLFEMIGQPNMLIHLAWGGLPNYKSLHHFEVELPSHYHFLSTLIRGGLKKVLVTGTCFEYGMKSGPLNEVMETSPNNPYALAKDVLRKQLEFLQKENSFSMTWARLFYMYGDGQAENSLWSQMKRSVDNGDKIFNMSEGEQLRDYLSIVDVAKYLVALALYESDIGVVNVCSGQPISIRKLVENWIIKYKWEIKLNLGYYPYPEYEPMAFWGERKKLDKFLNGCKHNKIL